MADCGEHLMAYHHLYADSGLLCHSDSDLLQERHCECNECSLLWWGSDCVVAITNDLFVTLNHVHSALTHTHTHTNTQIPFYPLQNLTSNVTMYQISCERHILTTFIIPDILLILAFAYGLYIFRWVQTEQLSTLAEAVSWVVCIFWNL